MNILDMPYNKEILLDENKMLKQKVYILKIHFKPKHLNKEK